MLKALAQTPVNMKLENGALAKQALESIPRLRKGVSNVAMFPICALRAMTGSKRTVLALAKLKGFTKLVKATFALLARHEGKSGKCKPRLVSEAEFKRFHTEKGATRVMKALQAILFLNL